MTQKFSLYADLSIRENLEFVARVYNLEDPRGAAQDAIRRLGLENRAEQLAGELSGGWKQRLALGACILPNPQLLLLDEPTAGVDPKARRDFWDEIHTLAHEGMTVLVSTHYMDEAERCHRLTYISNGRLLMTGTTDEIVARSGLHVYVIEGEDLASAARALEMSPGVDQVASFGATLHVVGRDEKALKSSIDVLARDRHMRVREGETTLEDVLIDLMDMRKERPA